MQQKVSISILIKNNGGIMECFLSNNEISLWIENGTSIQMKAVTKYGDPVEINYDEAIELSNILRKMADEIK
jgi:hypothetical protein